MNKVQYLIIGSFGAQNVGDELILRAAVEKYPSCIVMTAHPESSLRWIGHDIPTCCPPPTGFRSVLRWCTSKGYRRKVYWGKDPRFHDIEEIIFAGGGLFALSCRAVLHWTLMYLWLKKAFPNIPQKWEYQGVDKHIHPLCRLFIRYVLRRAASITVRDEGSADAVEHLGLPRPSVTGDRVREWLRPRGVMQTQTKRNAILIQAQEAPEDTQLYAKLSRRFPDHEYIWVIFAPEDRVKIPSGWKGAVATPKSWEELVDIFSRAEYVLAQRYHALVVGLWACGADKVFVLDKPYAEKVENFIAEEGTGPHTLLLNE